MLLYIHIPSPDISIYQIWINQKLSLKYIYHLWQQKVHKVLGQEHSLQKNETFFLTSKMIFLPAKAKKKQTPHLYQAIQNSIEVISK